MEEKRRGKMDKTRDIYAGFQYRIDGFTLKVRIFSAWRSLPDTFAILISGPY